MGWLKGAKTSLWAAVASRLPSIDDSRRPRLRALAIERAHRSGTARMPIRPTPPFQRAEPTVVPRATPSRRAALPRPPRVTRCHRRGEGRGSVRFVGSTCARRSRALTSARRIREVVSVSAGEVLFARVASASRRRYSSSRPYPPVGGDSSAAINSTARPSSQERGSGSRAPQHGGSRAVWLRCAASAGSASMAPSSASTPTRSCRSELPMRGRRTRRLRSTNTA